MEYIGMGICVVSVIAICAVLILKSKKKDKAQTELVELHKEETKSELINVEEQNESFIQIDMFPAKEIKDKSKLVEITDSKVLAHVNNLIPGLVQVGNTVNNMAQATQAANSEVLYRAIVPAGTKLTNSKAMEGAVRGFYRGVDGIQGHANLVAVEAQKGTAVVANSVAAALGIATMVVGQYYMTQINDELGVINDQISQITDFQDNEYRSRVFSLVSHVKKIADFQSEILENDELRLSKITQLDSLEEECTQLLGQANLTLAGFAKKTGLGYEDYEKALEKAQNWFMYQKSLLDVLYKISDLRYTLHLGAVSREQCIALLPTYKNQISDTQELLTAWHQRTTEHLGVDTNEIRRKRAGFDRVIYFLPGLFKENFNFRSIEKKTARMITTQALGHEDSTMMDATELYDEDVQLIVKDGKIYYLPGTK